MISNPAGLPPQAAHREPPTTKEDVFWGLRTSDRITLSFPDAFLRKIKHMRWYIWGHTRSYENHPAQRNHVPLPGSKSHNFLHGPSSLILNLTFHGPSHTGAPRLCLHLTPPLSLHLSLMSPGLSPFPLPLFSSLFPFISLSLNPCHSFSVTTCSSLIIASKLTDPFGSRSYL